MPRTSSSFLGEIGVRLLRYLGLKGLLSPKQDRLEDITPVLIVGDAAGPGSSTYRGRHFMIQTVSLAAAQGVSFRAEDAIVIDEVVLSVTVTGAISLVLIDPGTGAALGGFLRTGLFERSTNARERPPISQLGDAVTAGTTIWAHNNLLANQGFRFQPKYTLDSGAVYQFNYATALGFLTVSVMGHVY